MRPWAALVLGGAAMACADPHPSTLNQKCFHDEDCDAGQYCERTEGAPDGLCRMGDPVGTTTTTTGTGTGTTTSAGPVGSASSPPTTDETDPTLPLTSTASPTTDPDPTESSSTGVPMQCDDGTVSPGELCFADALLIGALVDGRGVAVGDLDEDGHVDIVVTDHGNGSDGDAMRFLGEGDGAFGVGVEVDLGFGGYERVVLGAISDNDLDVCAVTHFGVFGSIACARGDGTGGFAAATTHPTPDNSGGGDFDLILVDMNGDDDLDVVVTSGDEFLVGYEGTGSETFPSTASWFNEDAVSFPILGMTHADFNDDGNPDLVVTLPDLDEARVLLTDGSSGTSPISAVTSLPTAAGPVDVAVGDFDDDGELDVAAALEARVSVHLGQGLGMNFAAATVHDVDDGTVGIVAVDLDGDGLDDIVTANANGSITVLVSIDGQTFEDARTIAVPGAPTDLSTADFNEDSLPDVAVVADGGAYVVLSSP